MSKAIVMCRVCGKKFDRNALVEGVDYVKPVRNMYYHKACYESYLKKKTDVHSVMTDENWFNATWDFLRKDLKGDFDYRKVHSQWTNFLKSKNYKMSAKGMYFSLKYFYEVKKGDISKSERGIGIISLVYEEGCTYWLNRENENAGICEAIEQQIIQARNAEKVVVQRKKTKKKTINAAEQLDAIMGMEDDE